MRPETIRAEAANQKVDSIRRELDATRKQLAYTVGQLDKARKVKRVDFVPAKQPRRLGGDMVRVIANDLHGAKADRPAVAAFLADVKALAPQSIILNGDIVDCGGFLAEHHTLGYVAETSQSYAEDVAYANGFLDSIAAAAPSATIEYIEGNHDRRPETFAVTKGLKNGNPKDTEFLRKAIAPEFVLKLRDRGIPYYRLSECYDGLPVPGVIKRGKCYFLHGFSCAKHASAVTQMSVAGNVVFAHTHRAQADIVRRVSVGVVGAWNPGCLCQRQPLWQHGKPTDWTHGYAVQFVSRTGKFLHMNVPIIDGESLLIALLNK